MSNFRPIDRETGFLLPPSVDEWLPERHLARFVVEVIAGLDLRIDRRAARAGVGQPQRPEQVPQRPPGLPQMADTPVRLRHPAPSSS